MKKQITFRMCAIVLVVLVSLSSLVPANGQWRRDVIEQNLKLSSALRAGDIDGDGDNDIAACLYGNTDIVWYEYDSLDWSKHVIDTNLGGVGIVVTDLDGDDKQDLVVAEFGSNAVVWYKNVDPSSNSWVKSVIGDNVEGAEWVDVADLDSDGDPDVVATGALGDVILWYENNGDATAWTAHTIDTGLDGPVCCYVSDIDKDDALESS
jgi:hypothetical protein